MGLQYEDSGVQAYNTGTNVLPQFTRVTIDTNGASLSPPVPKLVKQAGTATAGIGVLRDQSFGLSETHGVFLLNKQGTVPMIASGAIATGAAVYGDVAGQVTASPNTNTGSLGLNVGNAATAQGDQIEVLPV
jgi:hypothetical protein